MIHFQIVVQKHENVFGPFLREPVIRKEKIVFRRHDCLDRRKFTFNPGHIVVGALVIEDYNGAGAGEISSRPRKPWAANAPNAFCRCNSESPDKRTSLVRTSCHKFFNLADENRLQSVRIKQRLMQLQRLF